MGHAIAKNTFYQKLKLLAGFINIIAYSGIRAISNKQYGIQKWPIHACTNICYLITPT